MFWEAVQAHALAPQQTDLAYDGAHILYSLGAIRFPGGGGDEALLEVSGWGDLAKSSQRSDIFLFCLGLRPSLEAAFEAIFPVLVLVLVLVSSSPVQN